MTWQRLAEFNWGTSDPTAINEHLRDGVGCTKKTADGHNYMFDSSDKPGIIYIPQKWSRDGLATEKTHTIEVKSLGGLRLWIRLDIDPADASTHDDRFVLSSTDGSYSAEKSVQDDQIPGDKCVDLHYAGLPKDKQKRYTLQVFTSDDAGPDLAFEDVPYVELAGLSPGAPSEDDVEIPSPGEEDSYPEESEQEEAFAGTDQPEPSQAQSDATQQRDAAPGGGGSGGSEAQQGT